ncbi:MAG: hypothetical protein WCK00_07650 [Deltaproteobacteria bacterium]
MRYYLFFNIYDAMGGTLRLFEAASPAHGWYGDCNERPSETFSDRQLPVPEWKRLGLDITHGWC